MGRAPCCAKVGLRRGPWTANEDALLTRYIQHHGEGQWKSIPNKAGLLRCGKSCRLRWMNYLRPDIKRGNITLEEEDLIIRLHVLLGNRWSLIAGRLPGRTDNEIKNYWNTHLSKKLKEQGIAIKECRVLQSKNNQDNNNNNNKVDQGSEDGIASKIYIPKPTRFTSIIKNTHEGIRDSTHNINESLLISEEEDDDSNNSIMECLKTLWSVQDGCFLSGEFAINNDISSIDDLHERLYQEYLQTLNSEEDHDVPLSYFDDSLFI